MEKVPPEVAILFGTRRPDARRVSVAIDPAECWDHASASDRASARERAETLAALGARLIVRGESDYPDGLLALSDPPPVLAVVGGPLPPRECTVAMVGSRAASPYGLAQAERIAGDLTRVGFAVASGLARGIDAAAHRGALAAGGLTVAVLPGSLDELAPRDHASLAEAIVRRGALVSEHVARVPVTRGAFVRRNRLIAALSAATVVVEADERSGARHTAAAAVRLGRPLLAVPGDVDRPTSRGVMRLLREGARPCADAGDVLAALERSPETGPRGSLVDARRHTGDPAARPARTPGYDEATPANPEARVRAALEERPHTVEAVAAASGLAVDETMAALLRLEWAGLAEARPGSRWARRGSVR